jgi:Retrotransposon gag protein
MVKNYQETLEHESFEEFNETFKEKYIHPEMLMLCLKQIQKIKYTGSIEKYTQEFNNLIEQCPERLHADNIIDFCNGISEKVRMYIMANIENTKTLENMYILARRFKINKEEENGSAYLAYERKKETKE